MAYDEERRIVAKDRKRDYCSGCGRYLWMELRSDLCDFCKDDQIIRDIRASNERIERLEKRRASISNKAKRESEW